MKDRETAQEKLEYEIFSEQCFEQEQLKRKEKECEELWEYHNKCCEEFENEKK